MSDRMAEAQRLLTDPLLVEMLDKIEADAIADWTGTRMDAVEQRELAYQNYKASRRVRDALKSVVDDGLVKQARAR